MPLNTPANQRLLTASAADFGLLSLRGGGDLIAQVLPSGVVYAIRQRAVLINQVLPGPAEEGLFRLLLRWRTQDPAGDPGESGWAPLVGAGADFAGADSSSLRWHASPRPGLRCETRLHLAAGLPAWCWTVRVTNEGEAAITVDLLHAQDLGLADEAAVRNNEAYTSQYVDLLPCEDERLGWTVLARQNQPTAEGRHPWLAVGCLPGAEAYCTDGWQFFGADHRWTGEPVAVRGPRLPSKRLQYEFAVAGLQTRKVVVGRGGSAEFAFVGRYLDDHPAPSGPHDLAVLHDAVAAMTTDGRGDSAGRPDGLPAPPGVSIFVSAPWLHGDPPGEADLAAWFPGLRRHVEEGADGVVRSFFCGQDVHVVTRAKETAIPRPHGHVLRSGDFSWNDAAQFGATVYAAGIFSAQTYLGNPSLVRLLPVVRNALGLLRAAGQRVFIRREMGWQQLGIPSVFAMEPGAARWFYRLGGDLVVVRVWCSGHLPACFLDVQVVEGNPSEFLVTHQLALGPNEFDLPGIVDLHPAEAWAACVPDPAGIVVRQQPGTCFAIAAATAEETAALRGDELIYGDGVARRGPYLTFQTRRVRRFGLLQTGTTVGTAALREQVQAARAEFAAGTAPARPPAVSLQLRHGRVAGVGRIDEVLPWFNHNAAIHFSAPHGLEQYGGAAWGVRDVCQGSVEWLLAAGRTATARRVLSAVFAQQYAEGRRPDLAGTWPQWFMFPPFQSIQQAHSHGDVCFWPVKALCDYLEASNDLAFLDARIGYTNSDDFSPAGPEEPVWAHVDRVLAHAESRFVPGTALVNYGDGDWDDTLQPADPAMRQRMISAWTVGLAFHTFRQLAAVCRRAGQPDRARRLEDLLARIRADFARYLMPDGVVAGFLVADPDLARARPVLHPQDRVTGIRYRLLPMTRSVLAELFTPAEARRHLERVERELKFADGVRLMSEPAAYHGGVERLFRRAETAANVGREIGLQYVHAHLRYAEAMAKVGEADRLWWALQAVNPVGLADVVPMAQPRQSNVYFSSSDADFADRAEAAARWPELRAGRVSVRGGWRLYSSGPGLFLHKVRSCLLGLREHFDEVVFDPVLPRELDGLVASAQVCGQPVEIVYRVRQSCFAPARVVVNGELVPTVGRELNPYRAGGLRVARSVLIEALGSSPNRMEVEL